MFEEPDVITSSSESPKNVPNNNNALADNTKARWLQPDGTYRRSEPEGTPPHNFQEDLMLKYQSRPIV